MFFQTRTWIWYSYEDSTQPSCISAKHKYSLQCCSVDFCNWVLKAILDSKDIRIKHVSYIKNSCTRVLPSVIVPESSENEL
jgi:hypothetical protein